MGTVTRGRSIFAALLMVVLGAGLLSPIGGAQDATPDVDTLDQICATLEASPEASPASPDASPVGGDATPAIGTPESATPDAGLVEASPEASPNASPDASPAADLEAELCGTPNA